MNAPSSPSSASVRFAPSLVVPAEIDWTLLRSFLEVARRGSLSRAAVALGSSQPTLSRQIGRLESQLGHALFERTARGVRLTEMGAALRAPVERMREQAHQAGLVVAGRSSTLAGTVRVTASEIFSAYLLPEIFCGLRDTHPEIQIELVASDTVENLLERDADIALRMLRPLQGELVARRLADQPLGLYARRDYLERRGRPTLADAARHHWIGLDRSELMLRGFRAAGYPVAKEFFGLRCDSQMVAWQAVLAGLGIGVGVQTIAAMSPQLVRVLRDVAVPPLPLWIAAHRELRATPRLSVVFNALAAAFEAK